MVTLSLIRRSDNNPKATNIDSIYEEIVIDTPKNCKTPIKKKLTINNI